MEMISVATEHFRAAAKFAGEHKLGLRAADALQLAVAGEQDATLCTMDKRLAAAGKTLGVATRLI
jgi:predicted nucleic acid-binding protein